MQPTNLNESQFNQIVDDTIIAIEDALDELDLDLDYETSGGILTITFENGTKIIINRQSALSQLWVAAKSGGYHLNWKDDNWLAEREQLELVPLLNQLFKEQSGEAIELELDY